MGLRPPHLDRRVLPCSISTMVELDSVGDAHIIAECRTLTTVHGERLADSVCDIHLRKYCTHNSQYILSAPFFCRSISRNALTCSRV